MVEERKYRGDSFVNYSDLKRLFVGKPPSNPGFTGSAPNPKGGVARGKYSLTVDLVLGDSSPSWYDDLQIALANATSQSSKEFQSGNPQGYTVVKKNYGGQITAQASQMRQHHNTNLASGMDRYDVVCVADHDYVMDRSGVMKPKNTLLRVAWTPAIGSAEERAARLEAFLSGKTPTNPSRDPQPERPSPTKDDEKRWSDEKVKSAELYGKASEPTKVGADRGGSATNNDFKDKLAKRNQEFEPSYTRKNQDLSAANMSNVKRDTRYGLPPKKDKDKED